MRKSIAIPIAILLVGGSLVLAACGDDKESTSSTSTQSNTQSMPKEEGVEVGGEQMLPSMTIVENASNAKNLTTLVAAVKAADLVDTLNSDGPFTVFAPTNEAFDKLPAGTVDELLKPENKKKLSEILTYHVVPGTYTSEDLKDGQKLKTVQGDEVTISKNGDQIKVNGATVETADVVDSNGVSFVIDSVLEVPSSMKK